MTTQETKAEVRARAMARRLEEAGFKVTVKVEHIDPVYFSDGRVMLGAGVHVTVHADGPQSWDDMYSFSFMSQEAAEHHRASTCYTGGHLYRRLTRRGSKKLSLKELRIRIGCEVSNARDAASQEV